MKNNLKPLIFPLLLLMINVLQSQNNCDQPLIDIDTIQDLNKKIKTLKNLHKNSLKECRTDIQLHIADAYLIKRDIDSSQLYFDKVIEEAKKTNNEQSLTAGYLSKADALSQFGKEHEDIIVLLEKSRQTLNKYPDDSYWTKYYNTYGAIASSKKDFEIAIKYTDSSIYFKKRIKDTLTLPSAYNAKGAYLIYNSDYEGAVTNFLTSLDLRHKFNDLVNISSTYYNLGFAYSRLDDFESAAKYMQIAADYARKEHNDYLLSVIYPGLSRCYLNNKEYNKALEASEMAITYSKKTNRVLEISRAIKVKGWIYQTHLKDYKKAEALFIEAYQLVESEKDLEAMFACVEGIVEANTKMGNYKKAESYLDRLKTLNTEVNSGSFSQQLYKNYSKFYERTKKPELALEYYKRYQTYKDSLSGEKIKDKAINLEKKFEASKKELEIKNLVQEQQLQKQENEKIKFRQYLFMLLTALSLAIVIIGFLFYKKLRKQERKLNETNSVKNRLFSIIAHDLRGMIIPFQRTGKIVKFHIDNNNQERAVQIAEALEKNSESLSNMLDNLLNWSLDQMNGYTSNPTKISLETELNSIIKSFEQHALYKKTTIDLQHNKDVSLLFDKGALHVIFRNLISNALKFTENGTIKIKFDTKEETLNLHISDNGIGMTNDQIKTLFKTENYQTTEGTKGEKGTGLGLNLVYRFVKMQNGNINASSEKSEGTSFHLSFPILRYQSNPKH